MKHAVAAGAACQEAVNGVTRQWDDEACLVARCQSGDRAAQEILVRQCQDRVYRLACSLLNHPEEALDATQEALVAMLRSLGSFRGQSAFRTWLYRLTTNVCLSYRRRLRVRTRLVTSLPDEDYPAPEEGPHELTLQRELQATVRELLAGLPPGYREVVVLREVEGLAYEEIAQALQLPLGTVQSRLSRGRQMLKRALLERRWEGRPA